MGIELSCSKFTQLKNDVSENNGLVSVVFLMYNFPLSLAALLCNISSGGEKIIRFLLFEFVLRVFFDEDFGIRIDEILLKINFFNLLHTVYTLVLETP